MRTTQYQLKTIIGLTIIFYYHQKKFFLIQKQKQNKAELFYKGEKNPTKL
jgi:hypothetical protein